MRVSCIAAVVEDSRVVFDDGQIDRVIICCETDRHQELVTAAAGAQEEYVC